MSTFLDELDPDLQQSLQKAIRIFVMAYLAAAFMLGGEPGDHGWLG